ncbi:MAG: hypothetical protein GY722_04785 [bacterium]|nr:hypothetical protein [bacterium]
MTLPCSVARAESPHQVCSRAQTLTRTHLQAQVISDRDTDRSRGFGFVEMASAEEGAAVISALNGSNVDGRDLTVSPAKEPSR